MTYCNKTCKPLQQNFTQLKAQIHTNTAENPSPTATKNRRKNTNMHKYHRKSITYRNKNRRKAQICTNTTENPPPTATKPALRKDHFHS